jgi:hypothetical protein
MNNPSMPPNWLDEFVANVSGLEPTTQPGFFVPSFEQPFHGGTTAPVVSTVFHPGPANLAIPPGSAAAPIDYMGVYLTMAQYAPDPVDASGAKAAFNLFGSSLIGNIGREQMIGELCALIAVMTHPDLVLEKQEALADVLQPQARARLAAALSSNPPHQLLARQPVLMALAKTFIDEGDFHGNGRAPRPDVAALMLSHAAAVSLDWGEAPEGSGIIGNFPEHVAADLACNQSLYNKDDLLSVLDRTLRLWRDYGRYGAPLMDGREPIALLEEASGLELEDILALTFALYAHRLEWKPGAPFRFADDFGCDMEAEKKEAYLKMVCRTPEEMTARLRTKPPRSGWDVMAFLETPVLRFPAVDGGVGSLMLIDPELLVERVTTGLYWTVHDHLKATEGDLARQHWTQAWGDMVEAMVEDEVRPHAPQIFGEGRSFFTEEDLEVAYPGSSRSDIVIDTGHVRLAIEVVSGRPSVGTIRHGSPESLRDDLERLVYKKIRQLDGTAECLIESPEALLGYTPPSRQVQPVIVAAGGFFMSPVVASAVGEYCQDNGFLDDVRIGPLAILTLDEVEMLEGLVEHKGISVTQVITNWKGSTLANSTLRNYLLDEFGPEIVQYRPSRMTPNFDAFADEAVQRLELRKNPDGQDAAD